MQIIPREYQEQIAKSAVQKKNTLIVLPTGTGKTVIGALIIEHFLKKKQKCLFLAPTKPLVNQHEKKLNEFFYGSGYKIAQITGQSKREERLKAYCESDVIVATPQTVKNDIEKTASENDPGGILYLFSCLIIDECHRSVGNYAYTYVANAFVEQGESEKKALMKTEKTIIGLTASPGGKSERIKEIMEALKIENVEIRTEQDPDLQKYIPKTEVKWVEVELPEEIKDAVSLLNELMDEKAKTLNELNVTVSRRMPRGRLSQIYRNLVENRYMAALGHFAIFYNAFHGVELLESESPMAYIKFLERLKERKNRIDWRFNQAANKVKDIEHPKITKLIELAREREGKKIIIFAQYRDQVHHIVQKLNENGISAKEFLGKGKEGSAGHKRQKETIAEFAEGKIQVLVASSIGEEGIDIPSADTAIFYEPVPSEIRMIQRRGRVGRTREGEVIILVSKNTRDEIFKYVSAAKERKMKKMIKAMAKEKKEATKKSDRSEIKIKKKSSGHGKKEETIQQRIVDYFKF
ncbi:MAG: DEAD/DEAH box helicase family protein [Candidatus Micrarchaeota archaeon]|nr:DEAD/DEAH box helicase family protein [Candidatus Micrarchaeota archaeon]